MQTTARILKRVIASYIDLESLVFGPRISVSKVH